MILKISGINIKIEVEDFFNQNTCVVNNEKYQIIIKYLKSFDVPISLTFLYEIDKINIYENNNFFYFLSDKDIILQIDSNNSVWEVMINKKLSKNALKEIILKKVLPLYCYVTSTALPLHATGVIRDNKLLCFSGFSTSGKSTLAAHMICNKGYSLVSDDVLNLFFRCNEVHTFPTCTELKLRKDSLEKLGCIDSQIKKPMKQSIRLIDVIILSETKNNEINLERIEKNQIEILLQNLFAAKFCGFSNEFLNLLTKLKDSLKFWELSYPRSFSSLDNVGETIIKKFEEPNYE